MLEEAPAAPDPDAEPEPPPADEDLCFGVSARTSDGEITAQVPCGSKIVGQEQVVEDDKACLRLTVEDPEGARDEQLACATMEDGAEVMEAGE